MQNNGREQIERWVAPERKFEGCLFSVSAGSIVLEDGTAAYREVVEHPGGVCVLPFDGVEFTLIRQYRIAVRHYILEAPAGKLEPDEDPSERALLELAEETGLAAARLVGLGSVFASVGYCSERIHLYLALDLKQGPARPEAEERIELVYLSKTKASELLHDNAIEDAKTCIVLNRALGWLETTGLA